jgi:phenylalanyl-tRNA synthetase alpha chain
VPVLEKRDLPQEVLNLLDEKSTIHTSEDFLGIPQPEIKAAIDKLKSRSMLQYETSDTEQVILTPEGTTICEEGSHEYKVWDAVRQNGRLPIKELPVGLRAALAHMGTMEKSRC